MFIVVMIVTGARYQLRQTDALRRQVFYSAGIRVATRAHVSLDKDTRRPSGDGRQSGRWRDRVRMQAPCHHRRWTSLHRTTVRRLVPDRYRLAAAADPRHRRKEHPHDSAVSCDGFNWRVLYCDDWTSVQRISADFAIVKSVRPSVCPSHSWSTPEVFKISK